MLFLLSAEKAHTFVFSVLKGLFLVPGVRQAVRARYRLDSKDLEREVFGIRFPNPVGLAAGFDKNASHVNVLSDLGFGFIEIGTVTPLAQPGNDKPRLFRLPGDEALINRMGFNNDGLERVAGRLRKKKPGIVIGGNIGKNKITPNEKAVEDYEKCFRGLFGCVDYFVVNVSSPNTPGLRELQEKEPLKKILFRLEEVNTELAQGKTGGGRKPILLKIAPDLTNSQLDEIIEVVEETGIDGLVATNTTLDRSSLTTGKSEVDAIGAGGLSGKPLEKRATEVIRYIHEKSSGRIPVIGVGGIHSAEDAKEKLAAGAVLVQLYTGFIYEGPGLVKKILRHIRKTG
jgi:dihydroorotate dehydrogenase